MAKRALSRLIRSHHVYTAVEAAIALGRTPRTVRRWITHEGLAAATDQRPWLIDGRDLKAFLDHRASERKVTLGDDQMFCLRCREARRPALDLVDYLPNGPATGLLQGICPVCDRVMHRAIRRADLPRFLAIFDGSPTMAAE